MPQFLQIDVLDRIHLVLEPGEFGGGLLVTADKEQRRPEDDDTDRRRDRVICPLLVLRTRGDCRHRQEPIGAGPQNPDRGRGRTAMILCFELGWALGPQGHAEKRHRQAQRCCRGRIGRSGASDGDGRRPREISQR